MIAYADASALFKLYVDEPENTAVRARLDAATQKTTALITYPEIRAALALAHRLGRISTEELARAKAQWDSDWIGLGKIAVDEARCREAGEMAETYGLRGFDSVHLACYAHLARTTAPTEVSFCCFDKALSAAAAQWRAAI